MTLEKIFIENKKYILYQLTFYDGIKEAVDIKNETIFLWIDEKDKFEIWLKIQSKSYGVLLSYLKNSIGICDLMEKSCITMYYRFFDKYNEFVKYKEIKYSSFFKEYDLKEYLPSNLKLGFNFIDKLEKHKIELQKTIEKDKEDIYFTPKIMRNKDEPIPIEVKYKHILKFGKPKDKNFEK